MMGGGGVIESTTGFVTVPEENDATLLDIAGVNVANLEEHQVFIDNCSTAVSVPF